MVTMIHFKWFVFYHNKTVKTLYSRKYTHMHAQVQVKLGNSEKALDFNNVIVTLYLRFAKCYHQKKLGEVYIGICIIFYYCIWLHNYPHKIFNLKKVIISDDLRHKKYVTYPGKILLHCLIYYFTWRDSSRIQYFKNKETGAKTCDASMAGVT